MPSSSDDAMTNPNWTTFPMDLVERIGGLLISDDASDFVRLRAVCHPWRSTTVETKSRADFFYPRNWIMLSNPKSSPSDVCFFNTSTHKSFSFDLTPYLDTYSLFRALDYLFLLKHKITQDFALLNPFMKSITPLPSKIESNRANAPKLLEDMFEQIIHLEGVFVTSSFTIVLQFGQEDFLRTKLGDQSWMYGGFNVWIDGNVLFCKDRLLFVTSDDRGLVQINLANEIPIKPQVEIVISSNELPYGPSMEERCYLVDCDGEIILVTFNRRHHQWESFETYKLDLNEKTYVRLPNLGNRSIFIGHDRTFSVSCDNLSSVPANFIYLCELRRYETACYNLKTNRVKCLFGEPFLNSFPLLEKLIKCCARPCWKLASEDDE
ncbi:F-box/kelch-repeat protein [Rhynchospora pubera]|uniref:F-box/kelch-repeat protein n=1 Tax=Rhynchospora pubera TaxID=906938 RepID=A0AAV8ANY2_9POAL|nr:F-box/kelch-repeat protein [Rhynchospora pubera]KAJ4779152.1 F-box/kelch-repeat protein [Rhynchospora pubera]